MAADNGVTTDTINADGRFTPAGLLGALLTLAERARDPGESLEAAFARVVRQDPAARALYENWGRCGPAMQGRPISGCDRFRHAKPERPTDLSSQAID